MTKRRRKNIRSALARGGLFAGLWVGLVGADPEGLALGLAVVPAALWVSLRSMPPQGRLRVGRFLTMLPGFHLRSVLGGLDVAARALAPRMRLAPGWVVAPSRLPPAGRVAMGASLSLMPGTLVAGTEGDRLLVHVLDRTADHAGALRAEEARLARLHSTTADAEGAPRAGGGA